MSSLGCSSSVADERSRSERHSTGWYEVTLFCAEVPRQDDDPAAVKRRAAIIFGEGSPIVDRDHQTRRIEPLGGGLLALTIVGPEASVEACLVGEYVDHKEYRFECGLIPRPIVVGLPGEHGLVAAPVKGSVRIRQFVRCNKLLWLSGIVGSSDGSQQAAMALLERIRATIGKSFRQDSLRWIGDVIIAERRREPIYWVPETSRDGQSCRRIRLVEQERIPELTVQVRAFGLDDVCLKDVLLPWHGEGDSRVLDFEEEVGGVLLRSWSRGELVHESHMNVCRGIGGAILVGGGGAGVLQDRLTEKLEKAVQGGAARPAQLEEVRRAAGRGHSIGFADNMKIEQWANEPRAAQAFFDLVRPPPPDYAYFPKGASGRSEAILRFARLISDAHTAYLIDPWFDSAGAEALLPRLSGSGQLTIVTNLPTEHTANQKKLQKALDRLGALGFAYNLKVVCVSGTRSDKQVFHDRCLLTRTGDLWRGFVLTNSFSGMATEYPLFVVEAPLGTTGLMLNEFDRLLAGSCRARQLWPRNSQPRPELADLRTFPYCFAVLAGVVCHGRCSSGQLVKLSDMLGFLRVRDGDGWSWRVDTKQTQEIIDWLIATPRSWSSPRVRARRRRAGRMACPFGIGRSVHIIGDLRARGLQVDARNIAARARGRELQLQAALRQSFREPRSSAEPGPETSPDRFRYRQLLRQDLGYQDAFGAGIALWSGGDRYMDRTSRWARTFAYCVLAELSPARAVALAEELFDADFMLSLTDFLHRDTTRWSPDLADALVQARAPVLRALGAQSIVWGSLVAESPREKIVPDDVPAAVQRLRLANVSAMDISWLLLSWGQLRPQPETNPGEELGRMLPALPSEERDDLVRALFDSNHESARLNGAIVHVLCGGSIPNDVLLRHLLKEYCLRFSRRERSHHFFAAYDGPKAVVAATILRRLSEVSGNNPWAELGAHAPVREIEREVRPLSPLRFRPNAEASDTVLGHLVLLDLLASGSELRGQRVELPQEVVSRAENYLRTASWELSKEVRELLRKILREARAV